MTTELEKQRAADALAEMTEDRAIAVSGGNPQSPPYWLEKLFNGGYGPTNSGIDVNERTALTFSAVFACVRVLSETLGVLKPFVYNRLEGGGKERVPEHPVYRLIHDDPNDEMIPSVWRQTTMGHICTWGNGYSEIERSNRGLPVALWPIEPHRVRVDRDSAGNLIYDVSNERGSNTTFDYEDILHIPGLGYDGIKGYSPVRMAMEAIGLGKAAEVFGAKFFGNGANSGGTLEHPGEVGPKAQVNLRESFRLRNQGLGNAFDPMILEEGMKFNKWTIPPNEAQFLETRKFQKTEVASIYRVPPHMIADLERATFSNIEHQGIDFVVHTMMPWLVVWEEWMGKRLLTREERRSGLFVEFLVTGLLRGDSAARGTYYQTMRNMGVLNADDIRELENMNPLPNGQGKTYWVPLNMGDAANPPDPNADKTTAKTDPPTTEEKPARAIDATKSALRIVALDAAKRIVRKETLAIGRAKKGEMRAKADEFFADHVSFVVDVLSPVAQAMTTAGMEPVDITAVASAHVARAKEACASNVTAWEAAGPVELVQELFGD
jgi:HK97 family phage portal protein